MNLDGCCVWDILEKIEGIEWSSINEIGRGDLLSGESMDGSKRWFWRGHIEFCMCDSIVESRKKGLCFDNNFCGVFRTEVPSMTKGDVGSTYTFLSTVPGVCLDLGGPRHLAVSASQFCRCRTQS